jgi:hypothetical protein
VVLDIGPHAGALVVFAPGALSGREIEIRACGQPWTGVHTAVRARQGGGGRLYAGVFGSLPPGSYELRLRGGGGDSATVTVPVAAGMVAEARVDP